MTVSAIEKGTEIEVESVSVRESGWACECDRGKQGDRVRVRETEG